MHLGVHVAEVLAAHGYFVVGFDAKAYLRSFTDGRSTLQAVDHRFSNNLPEFDDRLLDAVTWIWLHQPQ
jgi:hypothetical protein